MTDACGRLLRKIGVVSGTRRASEGGVIEEPDMQHMPIAAVARNALCGVFLLGLLASSGSGQEISTALMVGSEPVEGTIVGSTADGISFRLKETDDVVDIRWEMLPDAEVARIQKLVGMNEPGAAGSAGASFRGKQLNGVRVYLAANKPPIEGAPIEELDSDQYLYLRTRNVQKFRIPRKDIREVQNITVYEADVYSPQEIYEDRMRWPPQGPQDHYETAMLCKDLGLYVKAKEHLQLAELLDERLGERVRPMLLELDKLIEEKTAQDYYDEAIRCINTGNYGQALEIINKVEKYFPEHPRVNELVGRKKEVEEKQRAQLARDIVSNYYAYHEEFVRRVAYGQVTDGEQIPGLLVYLRDGRSLRGTLKEENEEFIILSQGNTDYRIDKREVVSKVPMNMNEKKRQPTLDEARAYVTDPQGGVSADIRITLARRFNIPEDEVSQLWMDRLHREVEIGAGTAATTVRSYASIRSAFYGAGIWLREGAPVTISVTGNRSGNQPTATARSTLEQDPERWWKKQPADVKYNLLKAMSVEKLMEIVKEEKIQCNRCGGKGKTVTQFTSGRQAEDLCLYCRGLGYTVKLQYR